jgi:ribosomal protein S27AE
MAGAAKEESKMICRRCGVEMNHHSDKIVYAADPEQAAPTDLTLGGFIEEFHTCPKCGGGASRQN